jgi:hypothetical protein
LRLPGLFCESAVSVAKKVRTPTPRPRQQGPQRRDSRTGGGPPFRPLGLNKRGLLAGIGVGVVAGAIILVVVLTRGGSSAPPARPAKVVNALSAAGCTLREVKPLPPKDGKNFHADVPALTTKVKWSSFPPSGGGHYQLWAVWGFYREPVNPRLVVHNLEHGAVVMWWGQSVPRATVDELNRFYSESPDGMFGTPITGLGNKIVLTAWTGEPSKYYRNGNYGLGQLATCTHFNEKAFAAFRDAFRGKGPEGIPLSYDKPGMGPQG